MKTKTCPNCKENKPTTTKYYHKDKHATNGFHSKCKVCRNNFNKLNIEGKKRRNVQLQNPEIKRRLKEKRMTPKAKLIKRKYDRKYNHTSKKQKYVKEWRENQYNTLEPRLKDLLRHAKVRARNKKIIYSLDFEWLLDMWNKQNGCCLISGLKLILKRPKENKKGSRNPLGPSLDRINSNIGYTKENTRLVCVHINDSLNEYGLEQFLKLANACLKNNKRTSNDDYFYC